MALGRGGILANKREGDGGTPRGSFRPRQLWWRGDRHSRPQTFLPARIITGADAWCEDPGDRHYNQWIRRGEGEGGDRLKRADQLYDFIIEIDHNTRPRIAGRGSAVFLHLARDNFGPTAGCVSMTKAAMLQLLRRLGPRDTNHHRVRTPAPRVIASRNAEIGADRLPARNDLPCPKIALPTRTCVAPSMMAVA